MVSSISSRLISPPSLHCSDGTKKGNLLLLPTLGLGSRRPSRRIRAVLTNPTGSAEDDVLHRFLTREYRWGFTSDLDSFSIPKGLSESTIRSISALRSEPEWLLNFRLKAYETFLSKSPPSWSDNQFPPIDLQSICYYSDPTRNKDKNNPEIADALDRLGISLDFKDCGGKVGYSDVILDSSSVASTYSNVLRKNGIIFCPLSVAIREYPELVKRYLGRVVPREDNYYAALNSAVFGEGNFLYIPKDTKYEHAIRSYFRINNKEVGQFERTLIVADERSAVKYIEGCSATQNDKTQLHAAVVELYCHEDAEIGYSTLQNWYTGDEEGNGGIYNFVTKRGRCAGKRSKIYWAQVEAGSAITWKYPSLELVGDDTVGEFYSVALTKNYQQADTGTKIIHKGKNSKSVINSKGISAGKSRTAYRGLVQINSTAENARNISKCDSLLIGDMAMSNTYPTIQVSGRTAKVEHEASTTKVDEDKIFYFQQRGIDPERAYSALLGGFCNVVFTKMPLELAQESLALLNIKLKNSVG